METEPLPFVFVHPEPPVEFTRPLQDQTVEEKTTATLECEVSRANGEVQWLRDDQEIRKTKKYDILAEGCKRTLVIHECTLDDSKTYTCDAKDFKTSCFLTVEKTTFTKNLPNVEGTETDSVRLICEVSKPNADVTWYKGDKELPDGGRYEHIVDGKKRILLIKDLKTDDAGEYSCRLSTGTKTSGNLKINGKDWKKVMFSCLPHFSNKAIKYKQSNQLANTTIRIIAYVSGVPFPTVTWKKNDAEVPTRADIETNQAGTKLEMRFCNRGDCGDYTLTVENPAGSKTATCTVLVDVKLIEGIIVKAGTTIRLPALMRGIPVPTAKWSVDGEEITSQGNVKIDTDNFSTVLNINECTRNHTGTYLLTVSNAAGTKTVALSVTVLDVPAAPIGPVNIMEVTPDSMTIEWRPPKDDGGSPVTNYIVEKRESNKETWGGVSSGSLETQLRITRLQKGTEYVVRIRAANKMGVGAPLESKPTVAEHTFMPPSPPGKPQQYDVAEDAVTIGWTMPLADGGSQITGYLIERRHKGGKWIRVNRTPCKDLRYRVQGLFEGSEYEFRVFAENIAGYSGPSPTSDLCKPCRPISVPSSPINPKVKDYSKNTADLVWTKPSRDGGSPILGYTVEMKKADSEEWKKVNLDDLIKQCAYRVKGLEEGVSYSFRVYASNMIGDGEPKEMPQSITAQDILIPPEIEMEATCRERLTVRVGHNINIIGYIKAHTPGPVGGLDATDITKTTAQLSWLPPENDGGSPIINYTVEKREVDRKTWTKCTEDLKKTSFKVTNMTPGIEYYFRVMAHNKYGIGVPQDSPRSYLAVDPISEYSLK
uniref:Titin n=1 Tax=Poecilia latipinna TaxID=48699 RepID=A0A3B3UXN0_9TELE